MNDVVEALKKTLAEHPQAGEALAQFTARYSMPVPPTHYRCAAGWMPAIGFLLKELGFADDDYEAVESAMSPGSGQIRWRSTESCGRLLGELAAELSAARVPYGIQIARGCEISREGPRREADAEAERSRMAKDPFVESIIARTAGFALYPRPSVVLPVELIGTVDDRVNRMTFKPNCGMSRPVLARPLRRTETCVAHPACVDIPHQLLMANSASLLVGYLSNDPSAVSELAMSDDPSIASPDAVSNDHRIAAMYVVGTAVLNDESLDAMKLASNPPELFSCIRDLYRRTYDCEVVMLPESRIGVWNSARGFPVPGMSMRPSDDRIAYSMERMYPERATAEFATLHSEDIVVTYAMMMYPKGTDVLERPVSGNVPLFGIVSDPDPSPSRADVPEADRRTDVSDSGWLLEWLVNGGNVDLGYRPSLADVRARCTEGSASERESALSSRGYHQAAFLSSVATAIRRSALERGGAGRIVPVSSPDPGPEHRLLVSGISVDVESDTVDHGPIITVHTNIRKDAFTEGMPVHQLDRLRYLLASSVLRHLMFGDSNPRSSYDENETAVISVPSIIDPSRIDGGVPVMLRTDMSVATEGRPIHEDRYVLGMSEELSIACRNGRDGRMDVVIVLTDRMSEVLRACAGAMLGLPPWPMDATRRMLESTVEEEDTNSVSLEPGESSRSLALRAAASMRIRLPNAITSTNRPWYAWTPVLPMDIVSASSINLNLVVDAISEDPNMYRTRHVGLISDSAIHPSPLTFMCGPSVLGR